MQPSAEREARQIADQVRTIDRMRLTAYLSELGGRFLPTIVEKIAEAEPAVHAYRRPLGEDEDYNVEAFDVVRNEVNADTTEGRMSVASSSKSSLIANSTCQLMTRTLAKPA
jgi:hypothetical protein